MSAERPVLISVMQYQDELASGTVGALDLIEAARRFGVAGVELRPEAWRDQDHELPAARALAERLGLLLTYATTTTLFGDAGGEALRRDIADTRALGASQLRVFPGPVPADDDAGDWVAAERAVGHAAAHGVTLALENYSGTPGGRVAEIARVLARIQSPALATNIDPGNYARHGEDIVAAIRAVGGRAVSAHLKDQGADPAEPPTALGEGVLPLRDILAALDHLPQRLLYCFEFRGGGDPEGRIARSLAWLRGR